MMTAAEKNKTGVKGFKIDFTWYNKDRENLQTGEEVKWWEACEHLNCTQRLGAEECSVYKAGSWSGVIHAKQGWCPVPRLEHGMCFTRLGLWQSVMRPGQTGLTQESGRPSSQINEGLACLEWPRDKCTGGVGGRGGGVYSQWSTTWGVIYSVPFFFFKNITPKPFVYILHL